MSPTLKFLIFAAFSMASLWAGYLCRKKRWLHEDVSRPVHFHTIVWVWSLVSLLSLWRAPLASSDMGLVVMQVVIVAAAGYGAIPIARLCGRSRDATGVIAVGAAGGNLGFTLGAYLCYSVLDDSLRALGYAIAYVSVMQIAAVVLTYPIARHFGREGGAAGSGGSLAWLMVRNLLDLRAMPLYGALAGQVLGMNHVALPAWITETYVFDVLFYLGSFGGYFGIGLRLRVGDSFRYIPEHAVLGGMKFIFIPILTIILLAALSPTTWALGATARDVVLILSLMPTAIQTVMLANLFHMDVRLASVLWLWNLLLFFMLPMPVIFLLFG
jgi:predicted permease